MDLVEKGRRDPKSLRSEVEKLQAALILLGARWIELAELANHLGAAPGNMAAVQFITALSTGEKKAVAMCLEQMKPRERRDPRIYVIHPRLMFLSTLLRQHAPQKYSSACTGWNNLLLTNRTDRRDLAGERWLMGSTTHLCESRDRPRET